MKVNQFKNLFQRNRAVLVCCVLALAGVLLVSCNATVPTSLFPKVNGETTVNPGDIAFTGIIYNGNSQFSFVPTTNIAAGVSIFFTNYSYDPTNSSSSIAPFVDESTTTTSTSIYPGLGSVQWEANMATTITEGTIVYVVGATGLGAYSQIIIGSTDGTDQLQGGSVILVAGGKSSDNWLIMNHNGAGQKILAYTVNSGTNTYVAAIIFGPDSWTTSGSVATGAFWDTYLPSSLTSGTNATDLSSLWNGGSEDGNLAQFNNSADQNDNAVLNICQSTSAGIVNSSNWQADGNKKDSLVSLSPVIGLTACTNAGYTGLIQ